MGVYVCFGTQSSFTAWLIRKITRGPYSHAWLEYDSPLWESKMVIHAIDQGITIQTPETVYKNYEVKKRYKFDWIYAEEGLKKCREYIGKPYDFKSVILNGLLLLLYYMVPIKKFRDWLWTKTVKDHSKYSCSEFDVLMMQKAEYPPALTIDAELTTPVKLEDFCEKHPEHLVKQPL